MEILFVGVDPEGIGFSADSRFRVHHVDQAAAAVQRMFAESFDGIVLRIPDDGAEEGLRAVESLRRQAPVPVIVLVDQTALGRSAVARGAQDYLLLHAADEVSLKRLVRYAVRLGETSRALARLSGELKRIKGTTNPFFTFFDHSPVGLAILDAEGRFVRTNRALQSILGCSSVQLERQALSMFVQPEDSPGYIENWEALREGRQESFDLECRFAGKGDRKGWWRTTLSLLRDRDGKPLFAFGIIKDVSRWKQSEVDLLRAKELAEATTRTKSEFLANMSHEIRTPIHTITGMAELLNDTRLDLEQKEYAEQIRFSADVLLSLVNDILDFSKIEAGKLALESIEFDLAGTVEGAVDLVVLEAHKKGLEVVLCLDTEGPRRLRGDPVRLRQIIVNLFSNAVKFTNSGEISITVEELERGDTDSTFRVTVRDTGIGISKEKLGRLFRSFSQADSSTTRKYGGTGLGLSISKNLAEMMGGEIGVKSREGKGSSFWFTAVFPHAAGPVPRPELAPESLRASPVLVVDDCVASREALRRYLEQWGMEVDEVSDGEGALERLRERAASERGYAAALVDLRLPGIDGWQLASEINADKDINSTRLLLMTPAGLGGPEAKMKLLKWFDGYLYKPVKHGELLGVVGRILSSERELEAVEDVEEAEELPATPEVSGAGPPIRVLVAEDHEVNQQLLKTILERLGCEVALADDGAEAVEAGAKGGYDLIFMDIQMPNLNGFDATRKLREQGVRAPIIAVTASAAREERTRAVAAGMDDYLAKPFKKKDLVTILTRWVGAGTEGGAAGQPEDSGASPSSSETVRAFDLNKAVEVFLGRQDVVLNVLEGFVSRTDRQIAAIGGLLEKGDLYEASREAHAIKGGALNLEARPLGEAARALESAAKEPDPERARAALAALEAVFSEFQAAVDPLLASGRAQPRPDSDPTPRHPVG